MDRRLIKIKRLVSVGRYRFTAKADAEILSDGLTQQDVVESILMAQMMRVKNSTSIWRQARREQIFIIESANFEGAAIYSKGVLRELSDDQAEYYILISGKRSTRSG